MTRVVHRLPLIIFNPVKVKIDTTLDNFNLRNIRVKACKISLDPVRINCFLALLVNELTTKLDTCTNVASWINISLSELRIKRNDLTNN